MNVKLLTENRLEFQSFKEDCTGSSESLYTCQNATLLEFTCRGSYIDNNLGIMQYFLV